MSIDKGLLYVVATPIGNLADLSPRAVETLSSVALIAAEDTRHSKRLLQHYGIKTPCVALHEHNERAAVVTLMDRLTAGLSIALISDAGTPLISDPGYHLVTAARAAGIRVVPVPGPCALVAALCASGLPSDRFVFEGFLPARSQARRTRLEELKNETRTLIFYEVPHRILECMEDLTAVLGEQRQAVLARELSKLYETLHGDSLAGLCAWLHADPNQQKGEFVILVRGSMLEEPSALSREAEHIMHILLTELPLKQASGLAAQITGLKKNSLYDFALRQKDVRD